MSVCGCVFLFACMCAHVHVLLLACVEVHLCGACVCVSKLKAAGPCVTAKAFDVWNCA